MTPQQPTQPKPAPQCAICGKPAQAIIAERLVCQPCYETADDPEVRLWRKSLTVVKGGLPC